MAFAQSKLIMDRLSFGFHNPNHAAALACALLPLCLGWRRAAWAGRGLAAGLFVALLLTQSRTGLLVAALEWAAWWALRRGDGGFHISDLRDRMGFRGQRAVFSGRVFVWLGKLAVVSLAVGLSLWWLGPRLALDGSILNRPKIWLAGLRLFAANPNGVGLGNSGALASAFLLPGDVPDVRTLVSSHLTLLVEGGWLVGWAHFAFLALALCGVRRSPRVGLAFAGLALSGCSSTVFDWPTLFDFAERGGLGTVNWALSWTMFALFLGLGAWLAAGSARRPPSARPAFASAALAGFAVLGLRLVPPGDAPQVRDGYAAGGAAPRTLALHDASWSLREVCARAGRDVLVPVRPVARYPAGLGLGGVGRVLLLGDCREWAYLVPKGISVTCMDD